jgi:hypothetical protein
MLENASWRAEAAERPLWKQVSVNHHYQQIESVCHLVLVISVMFALLYSLSVFVG